MAIALGGPSASGRDFCVYVRVHTLMEQHSCIRYEF